jgi:hypothetical protein
VATPFYTNKQKDPETNRGVAALRREGATLPLIDDESRDKCKDKLSCLHFLFSPFTSSKTLTYNLYSLLSLEFFLVVFISQYLKSMFLLVFTKKFVRLPPLSLACKAGWNLASFGSQNFYVYLINPLFVY